MHTKGDWKVRDYDIILKGSGSRIAKMDTGWSNKEILANSNLIAASPRMLEALKEIKLIYTLGNIRIPRKALDKINEALSQAEGK